MSQSVGMIPMSLLMSLVAFSVPLTQNLRRSPNLLVALVAMLTPL
jgi:hypothetical protein